MKMSYLHAYSGLYFYSFFPLTIIKLLLPILIPFTISILQKQNNENQKLFLKPFERWAPEVNNYKWPQLVYCSPTYNFTKIQKKSYFTFINFQENFPPTLLFSFKTISLLHYFLGLLLYSDLSNQQIKLDPTS